METVQTNLIEPLEVLNLPKLVIDDFEHKKVIQGQVLENRTKLCNDFLILIYNNRIDAVAFADGSKIKVKKVFV